MSYRLEFVNDPTRVLTHSFEKNNRPFIAKICGLPSLKRPVWVVVLDEDEIIAVANVVQFVFDLAKDVSEKFWTDRGVLVGNKNDEDHPTRRKAFLNVCENYLNVCENYTNEGTSFVLWWLLDDIDMQCEKLKDHNPLQAACDYAERKIIEYALTQQELVP